MQSVSVIYDSKLVTIQFPKYQLSDSTLQSQYAETTSVDAVAVEHPAGSYTQSMTCMVYLENIAWRHRPRSLDQWLLEHRITRPVYANIFDKGIVNLGMIAAGAFLFCLRKVCRADIGATQDT